jgi:hypothetical protein
MEGADQNGFDDFFREMSIHVALQRPETMKIAARVYGSWERRHPCLLGFRQ